MKKRGSELIVTINTNVPKPLTQEGLQREGDSHRPVLLSPVPSPPPGFAGNARVSGVAAGLGQREQKSGSGEQADRVPVVGSR